MYLGRGLTPNSPADSRVCGSSDRRQRTPIAPAPMVNKTDGQSTKPKVTGSNPVGRASSAGIFARKTDTNGPRGTTPAASLKRAFVGLTPSGAIAQPARRAQSGSRFQAPRKAELSRGAAIQGEAVTPAALPTRGSSRATSLARDQHGEPNDKTHGRLPGGVDAARRAGRRQDPGFPLQPE